MFVVVRRFLGTTVIGIITRAVGGRCSHLDLGIERQQLSSPSFLAIVLAASFDPSFHGSQAIIERMGRLSLWFSFLDSYNW